MVNAIGTQVWLRALRCGRSSTCVLPDIPQHIVRHGNNRLPCFLDDADQLRYQHLRNSRWLGLATQQSGDPTPY
ncbi:hypothetical protein xavtCFBP7764_08250 [Xanthomonas citri]|nr:hypothetical protein xavtCFBP7764_08250 [Xanthomonas citri]